MLNNIDLALNYLASSSAITLIVLFVLSFYLIVITTLFIYRWVVLSNQLRKEEKSLNGLIVGNSNISENSILNGCLDKDNISKEILKACEVSIQKDATKGLTLLSIVSSTSPFIGLFGTVISILESFAKFATVSKMSFNVIAPVISEALVATAAGIFVAIFAYTFHQILNRKGYELSIMIKAASEIMLSKRQGNII